MSVATTLTSHPGPPEFSGAYLFLTNRCNLRCRYCYVPQDHPAEVGEEVVRWTVDFLIKHAGSRRRPVTPSLSATRSF